MLSRPCRNRRPSACEDGGVSGVSSSCDARGGFLPRHDEDLREPLVRRQGSQVSMRVATHSSILAWRISGTREPGGLPSMGSHRVGHLIKPGKYSSPCGPHTHPNQTRQVLLALWPPYCSLPCSHCRHCLLHLTTSGLFLPLDSEFLGAQHRGQRFKGHLRLSKEMRSPPEGRTLLGATHKLGGLGKPGFLPGPCFPVGPGEA